MTRKLYAGETPGYQEIMLVFRMGDTDWGDTMGMLFALAEVAYVFDGELMPEFRPSPFREIGNVETLDRDSYPDGFVIDWREAGTITLDDMRKAFTVLSRYADFLKLAGLNY